MMIYRYNKNKMKQKIIEILEEYHVYNRVPEELRKKLFDEIASRIEGLSECQHQWQEVWKDNNHQSSWGANRCMKCDKTK
jgi:hypothetical protein